MKLHIDSTQAKLEELEKFRDDPSLHSAFESLKKENARLSEKIRALEKHDNSEEKMKLIKEINMLKSLTQKDSAKNMELEKANKKLELEVNYLQRKLEILGREMYTDRISAKENRPEAVKKFNEEKPDGHLKNLTDRNRNFSRQDFRKTTSKSPIPSKNEMKRTESQLMASNRYKIINDKKRKGASSSNSNVPLR